jgi:hypothetical protein
MWKDKEKKPTIANKKGQIYYLWLRVFENWVLRKILGPKRDEVTGEWRRLHNEELYGFTPYQILFG